MLQMVKQGLGIARVRIFKNSLFEELRKQITLLEGR